MSETLNPTPNGRTQRRSLSAELDRFDRMIDGLDQGIKEVITDGVKESVGAAVGEAVRATLLELVTHPNVMGMLGGENMAEVVQPATADSPGAPARPTLLQRFANNIADFGHWLVAQLRTLGRGLTWPVRKLSEVCANAGNRPILGALLIGILIGCLGTAGAPWVAAGISGLGAIGATLGARIIHWKRHVFVSSSAC